MQGGWHDFVLFSLPIPTRFSNKINVFCFESQNDWDWFQAFRAQVTSLRKSVRDLVFFSHYNSKPKVFKLDPGDPHFVIANMLIN